MFLDKILAYLISKGLQVLKSEWDAVKALLSEKMPEVFSSTNIEPEQASSSRIW